MKQFIYSLFTIALSVIMLSNNEAQAQMFWNNACSFAGTTSSYINRGSSSTLDITGSFSLEAWLNPTNATTPSFQIILQKREGANVDGYTLYLSNGKVAIRTNATTRLIGKTVLTNNNWTHVAGTYSSASGLFSVFVNGSLDTSVTIAAAAPVSSTDTLFIGKGFNSPFAGQMDEVRIWDRNLSSSEVNQYRRTSLGTSSGIYDGLVMSITFQDNDANGAAFILTDWSGNNNNGINRGVTAVDLSNRPLQTISINECVELNGSNEYLATPDAGTLSPSSEITLEAWIFPRSFDKNNIIIHKGSNDGFITDYCLKLTDGKLKAVLNNFNEFASDDPVPLDKWSHAAFVYDGPTGSYAFYLNGKLIDAGSNFKGFIIDGTDSLYIGGTTALTDFDGFIDEVRISDDAKSENEINRFLFKSIDESNDGPSTETVYNFDGYLVSNVGSFNRLFFRNGANFSHSGALNDQPLSPLNRSDALNFEDGYYLKSSDRRIPSAGNSGLMTDDTLKVFLNETITDINIYVALNHNNEQDIEMTLVAPNGDMVSLCNDNSLVTNSDNLVTIFNDQADSTIVNGRFVSFGPVIKPLNDMNAVFSGDNSSGIWTLRINDDAAATSDTGRLYAWGIQFNNRSSKPTLLSSSALIQGFYNAGTNLLTRDTMRYVLRYTAFPYDAIDTGKAYLQTSGVGVATLNNIDNGILYYIQLKHRNSIQTWSSVPVTFDALTSQAQYNFDFAATQAFGDNMIQVDAAPVKFAVYGGDVNQDDIVDVSDVTLVYNDANIFAGGYISTDLTGDNFTDATDLILAYNNSINFVSAIVP